MQRRTLLKLGVASGVVFVVAGATLATIQPGLRDGRLSAGGRTVFSAVSLALLDGTLPPAPADKQIAVAALLDRIDGLTIGLPPHAQAELSQLLAILASAAGRHGLAGLSTPWDKASVADIQAALQAMRTSSLALRQQAYHALHDITGSAYFSEPGTWSFLGYPGPRSL